MNKNTKNIEDFMKYVSFCEMFGLNKNNPDVLNKYLITKKKLV